MNGRVIPPIPGVPDLSALGHGQLLKLRDGLVAEVQQIQEQLGDEARRGNMGIAHYATWRRGALRALHMKEAQLREIRAKLRSLKPSIDVIMDRLHALRRRWAEEGRPEAAELNAALHPVEEVA